MNFKSLRVDKLKLSQEELANIIGVEISKIKEWEENNEPSMTALQKISICTGMDFNTIMSYEKPKPKALDTNNTWGKIKLTKKNIVDYISESLKDLVVPEELRRKYVDDLRDGIERNLVKPSVSIVGRSDTGKSTLINTLIGMEKMPTSWTPTTSIAVYIKHINDRPQFVKDDVWIFADYVDGEDLWDANRLYDEEYCEKWKIAQGGVEILSSFGTRQGDNFTYLGIKGVRYC